MHPLLASIALITLSATAHAEPLPYEIDLNTLTLSAPPAAGSDAESRDVAILRQWQSQRTHEQCAEAAAQSFKKLPSLFFQGGELLSPSDLQRFTPLLNKLVNLSMRVTQPFQDHYARKRPYMDHLDLNPCVERPNAYSYPSSHATTGMLLASLLAEIAPSKSHAFLELGLRIGQNRVISGAHYPSDVAAGQSLAGQLVRLIRVHPVFRQEARELATALRSH